MNVNKLFRLVCLAACFSTAAQAAFFSDDEARRGVQRTDQSVRTLESRLRQLEDAQHNQTEALTQLEQIRQDTAQLRGQIEILQNDLDQLKRSQHDFYTDLDRRIKTLEIASTSAAAANNQANNTLDPLSSPNNPSNRSSRANAADGLGLEPLPQNVEAPTPAVSAPSAEVQAILKSWKASPDNERKHYDQAMGKWKANKYSDSAPMFFHFAKLYPKSALAPASLYYAGLSWRMNRNNDSAQEAFQTIVQYYPESPRMPNALFVLGQIAYEQGDMQRARRLWKDVSEQYPLSDVSKKARTNLETYKLTSSSKTPTSRQ